MSEDKVMVYSEDEVEQANIQAAYISRVGTVLLIVHDELIKSGAAPIVIDTINDIMTDYGLIQQVPAPQPAEEMKQDEAAATE